MPESLRIRDLASTATSVAGDEFFVVDSDEFAAAKKITADDVLYSKLFLRLDSALSSTYQSILIGDGSASSIPIRLAETDAVDIVFGAEASRVGFFGTEFPVTRPTVTGSDGGNAALISLLQALASLNLIDNAT